MDIRGKVALITGASEGIGAACARALARRGARLALNARSEEKLRSAAPEGSLVVAGDIAAPGTAERLVESAANEYGRVDLVVNNAGVGLWVPSHQAEPGDARRMFDVNFFAPLRLVQLAVPLMKRGGGGTIVNVGSIAGRVTLPWLTLYSASKYALGSLSDGLRMELRRHNIRTMTVCPGYVTTAFQSHMIGGQVPDKVARSKWFTITADQCAEAIAKGIEGDRRTVVTPGSGWLLIAAARLAPRLLEAQLERMQ